MGDVESLERDQGGYKYIYMFVRSTCSSMHRPIFMHKLVEFSRSFKKLLELGIDSLLRYALHDYVFGCAD